MSAYMSIYLLCNFSGPEIRKRLDEKMAQLYWDLDGGFTPAAWLLPSWLPLPSFRLHMYISSMTHNNGTIVK